MKNKVNKVICTSAGIGILVFGSMIDSRSYLPAILCGICTVIVFAYGVANGWIE